MKLRGDRPTHDTSRAMSPRRRFDDRKSACPAARAAASGLVVAAMLAASGCKASLPNSPLAWWPGASKGSADNEKLASAPSFDGKVEKPSETQSPYPTTTTPQSYALDGQKPPALAAAATAPVAQPPAAGSSPVTYGVTPPPAPSNAAATAVPPNANGVAAQVGPYQGWPAGGGPPAGGSPVAQPPAPSGYAAAATPPSPPPASAPAAPVASSSAALGFGSASSMAPDAVEPPDRYADARFGGTAANPTTAEPVGTLGGTPASRYAASGASQFGGEPAATPAAPAAFVPSASPGFPAAVPPTPAAPASDVPDPSAFAPPSGTNKLRAPSASASPATPPGRRPDPGYRPGGTSTYRPSQAIVDEPADDRPVRQASFDSPLR